MKILILDNLFNRNLEVKDNISVNLYKFLDSYKKIRLNNLIRKILKKNKKNIEIRVISENFPSFPVYKSKIAELMSDYRINLDKKLHLEINEKIKKSTKKNLVLFLKNLSKIKIFNLNQISIGKLIELDIMYYFKIIFGNYELIKHLLNVEHYDRVVLINTNPYFLKLFKNLNQNKYNLEICNDYLFNRILNLPKFFEILYYIKIFIENFKTFNQNKLKEMFIKSFKKILIFTDTKNQYDSIKFIDTYFKYNNKVKVIHYQENFTYPIRKFPNLLRTISNLRRIWNCNKINISREIRYDSIDLINILDNFFKKNILFWLIRIHNNLYHFKKFITKFNPSLMVVANDEKFLSRMFVKYCKIKRIPTFYVPHAALPINDEIMTKTDIEHFTVSGEREKEYLVSKGEPKNKIFVTGRACYDKVYKGQINQLIEVKDMFTNRIYKFDSNKFTILLTTNPIDFKSNEILLSRVIISLKKLNLINNLIIKLHPREDGLFHKKIIKNLNVNPIIIRDYDILELISSCNLLLTRISTTILESMIIGKPVILLELINDNFKLSDTYIFVKDNILIKVENENALINEIKHLMENHDYYLEYSKLLKKKANLYSLNNKNETPSECSINLIKKIIDIE
jgi:hypothetical protein